MGIFDSIKSSVSAVAPILGAAIGGPFGAMAVNIVSKILIGKEHATNEELAHAMETITPEKLLELQKGDQQFKVDMKKLGIDEEKLRAMDRQRAREMALSRDKSGKKDWLEPLIAVMIIAGFFGTIAAVLFLPIQHAMANVADILIGALGAAFVSVYQFYFGSSKSSSDKTKIISEQNKWTKFI